MHFLQSRTRTQLCRRAVPHSVSQHAVYDRHAPGGPLFGLVRRGQETAAGCGVRYDAVRSLVGVILAVPMLGEVLGSRKVLAVALTLCGVASRCIRHEALRQAGRATKEMR